METKLTSCITLTLLFITQIFFSQKKAEKTLIAKYSLYHYSTDFFDHDSNTPDEKKSFDIALRRTKEFKYTFISDFKSEKGVFALDSIITTPVEGKESYWIEPENVTHFAYNNNNIYYKKESIFKHDFYVKNTSDFSFEWEITNEQKKVAGFNCIKAISKTRKNKITAWFTSEIPINYSPLGLYGLPGLILQAETFFSTITIENIKYTNNSNQLTNLFNNYKSKYDTEKKDDEIKGSILMLKKGQLIQQLKMMQ